MSVLYITAEAEAEATASEPP